ncbi:uncharacterized protein CLUP02_15398 [Colletotrichum lupini]|uniref:Uncharacterized protein n=1 Tax=Colletotrichum lupini TaxID=145971 RepID=A0A9Q8T7X5_9PEZI|nr:uncharacterized protein CLUP02_15398 [Colletotrichum lupini]UQC89867.1 hypothetical protein CLUP02_15398 [Colletotrichum lupini]
MSSSPLSDQFAPVTILHNTALGSTFLTLARNPSRCDDARFPKIPGSDPGRIRQPCEHRSPVIKPGTVDVVHRSDSPRTALTFLVWRLWRCSTPKVSNVQENATYQAQPSSTNKSRWYPFYLAENALDVCQQICFAEASQNPMKKFIPRRVTQTAAHSETCPDLGLT